MSRDQVEVELVRYEPMFTPKCKVRFVVSDKQGRILQEQVGRMDWHPASLREKIPAGTYPNWTIVEVNGMEGVYEQSEPNELLRIVNKPLE